MTNILFLQLDVLSPYDITDKDLEDDEYAWKSEEYREVCKWHFANSLC